MVAVVVVVVNS